LPHPPALQGDDLLLQIVELTGQLGEMARLDLRLGELGLQGRRLRSEGIDLGLVGGRELRVLLESRQLGQEVLGLLEQRTLVRDIIEPRPGTCAYSDVGPTRPTTRVQASTGDQRVLIASSLS